MRKFQSRRSLLIWKIFGERRDGWTNDDHPTESSPGNASTLPAGAHPNKADLDFTGTIMPPPDSGVQPLTADEKMLFARWIDLGAPSDPVGADASVSGWFVDDLRPTLHVHVPGSGSIKSLSRIEFVAGDYYSGLNTASLSVVADFAVNDSAPGAELAGLFTRDDGGRWLLDLKEPITTLEKGQLIVKIADQTGNFTTQEVTFSVDPDAGEPEPEKPTPTPTPGATPTSDPNATPGPGSTPTPGATPTRDPNAPPGADPTSTPDSGENPSRLPRITSPATKRVVMGRRFTYVIKGENISKAYGPITFKIKGPKTVRLAKNGRLTGTVARRGKIKVQITALNKHGSSTPFTLTLKVQTARSKSRATSRMIAS